MQRRLRRYSRKEQKGNRRIHKKPVSYTHLNPSLHHIKKENIGLIEVMGLAVLPARLANEIKALEMCIRDSVGTVYAAL